MIPEWPWVHIIVTWIISTIGTAMAMGLCCAAGRADDFERREQGESQEPQKEPFPEPDEHREGTQPKERET